MQDLVAFLEANSALVLANPAVFATFAFLFGGGGFVVGRYLLTERIANLESRIARRDEEIVDLRGEQKAPKRELSRVPLIGTTAIYQSEPERLPMLGVQLPAERKGNQRV
jgi:hypothetical protein